MYNLLPELWLDIANDLLTVCKLTMVSNILKDLLANKHKAMNDDPSDNDLRSIGLWKYYRYNIYIIYHNPSSISKRLTNKWLMKDDNSRYIIVDDKINQPICYIHYLDVVESYQHLLLLSPNELNNDDITNIIHEPHMVFLDMEITSKIGQRHYYCLLNNKDGTHPLCKKKTVYRISPYIHYCVIENNSKMLEIFKECLLCN